MKCLDYNLPGAIVNYYPNFLDSQAASALFDTLYNETPWNQAMIKVFGKVYPQPRLTTLYANNKHPYSYSNITMHPQPFTAELLAVKKKIEACCNEIFTTCLLNLYRDGKDSNGWHADNEPELGKNPVIASLSLGAERWFHLKHRYKKELKEKILLQHGSLLIMKGTTQHEWLHQIPKVTRAMEKRINLTYRTIKKLK